MKCHWARKCSTGFRFPEVRKRVAQFERSELPAAEGRPTVVPGARWGCVHSGMIEEQSMYGCTHAKSFPSIEYS